MVALFFVGSEYCKRTTKLGFHLRSLPCLWEVWEILCRIRLTLGIGRGWWMWESSSEVLWKALFLNDKHCESCSVLAVADRALVSCSKLLRCSTLLFWLPVPLNLSDYQNSFKNGKLWEDLVYSGWCFPITLRWVAPARKSQLFLNL